MSSTFGTVIDHETHQPIQAASAEEWRYGALLLNGDGSAADPGTGAWQDDGVDYAGRVVYVAGGPPALVTDEDIAALRDEPGRGLPHERQVHLCRIALGEARDPWDEDKAARKAARVECVRIILCRRAGVPGGQ